MVHCMKLELKKISLWKYVLLSAGLIVLSMFFCDVALHDSSGMGYDYDSILRVMDIIFVFMFVIYFSVMCGEVILREYNYRTILILFTYPVNRRKLIWAKLLLITIFIAASVLIGYLCCGGYIVWLDMRYDLLVGEFGIGVLKSWSLRILSMTVTYCCLGMWSFAVGMIKKSVSAGIVSAVLFIFLRHAVMAGTDVYRDTWQSLAAVLVITAVALRYVFTQSEHF